MDDSEDNFELNVFHFLTWFDSTEKIYQHHVLIDNLELELGNI